MLGVNGSPCRSAKQRGACGLGPALFDAAGLTMADVDTVIAGRGLGLVYGRSVLALLPQSGICGSGLATLLKQEA